MLSVNPRVGATADVAPGGGRVGALAGPAVVLGVVLGAALVGIWSRSALPLASFWPANALLLGMFVRWPGLRSAGSWVAAVAGYLAADLLTGSALGITVWLTVPNLVGPVIGVRLFDRVEPADRRLARPESVLLMLGIALAASVGAALPGMYCGSRFFAMTVGDAFLFWTTSEIASFLGILPVVLSAPSWREVARPGRRRADHSPAARADRYGPVVGVVASLVLGVVVNGPGALAFCVPALLWGALRSGFFVTACLVLLATSWNLLALGFGHLDFFEYDDLSSGVKVSLQSGLALMSLGPLMVAASTRARERTYQAMVDLAACDELTGVLTRRAFNERARSALSDVVRAEHHVAVLMIDIDHFKGVNDTYGHAAGDRVLRAVAATVRANLRETDALGRIGGEEFAAILPGVTAPTAELVAGLIRSSVEAAAVPLGGAAHPVHVTVSIGMVHAGGTTRAPGLDLDPLLAAADRALYAAKDGGRNQVRVGPLAAAEEGAGP